MSDTSATPEQIAEAMQLLHDLAEPHTAPETPPAAQTEPATPPATSVVDTVEVVAQGAAPIVGAINPAAGLAIELGVALLNSLKAMEAWTALVPDGQAKHGLNGEIANMRDMLQP